MCNCSLTFVIEIRISSVVDMIEYKVDSVIDSIKRFCMIFLICSDRCIIKYIF